MLDTPHAQILNYRKFSRDSHLNFFFCVEESLKCLSRQNWIGIIQVNKSVITLYSVRETTSFYSSRRDDQNMPVSWQKTIPFRTC